MGLFCQKGRIALQMYWITMLSLNKQDMAQQTIALGCASLSKWRFAAAPEVEWIMERDA